MTTDATELPSYFRADAVPEGVAVVKTGRRGVVRRADAEIGQWDDLVENVLSHPGAKVVLTTAAIYHDFTRAHGGTHYLALPKGKAYGYHRLGLKLVVDTLPDEAYETVVLSGVPVQMAKPAVAAVHQLMMSPVDRKVGLIPEEDALEALASYVHLSRHANEELLPAAELLGASDVVKGAIKGVLAMVDRA